VVNDDPTKGLAVREATHRRLDPADYFVKPFQKGQAEPLRGRALRVWEDVPE
jgi:hypothetical protein